MRRVLALVVVSVLFALVPVTAFAKPAVKPTASAQQTTCSLPESDAESLEILSNYYPGYWWDHTHLTIFVQAQPGISEEYVQAIDDAIATWGAVLEDCFDGLITLTQVDSRQEADIVVHYVAHAGGAVFAGYAICGDHGCPNILVSSDAPPSWGQEPYSPELLGWICCTRWAMRLGWGMRRISRRAPT